MKKIRPTYYAQTVDSAVAKKIAVLGYEVVLCDLDNTLTSFKNKYIDEVGKGFLDELEKNSIKVYVISNNSYKRCKRFSEPLSLEYLYNAHKPHLRKVLDFVSKIDIANKKTIIVGDQLLSDIRIANRLNIDSLLCEPKECKDLLVTFINRSRDKRLRKFLRLNGLLKDI